MPVTPKISQDEFVEKIKSKYPDYKDVDSKELLNKILTKYPEYKEQIDFEKKSSVLSVGADGQLKTSVPTTSQLPEYGVDVKAAADENKAATPNASEFDSFSPVDLANQSAVLLKPAVESDINNELGGATPVIDPTKVAQSKKITDYLGKNKIDAKEVNRVFGDIPNAAYEMTREDGTRPQSKDQLFKEWQSNPIDAENKINNIKTQFALKNAGNDQAGNEFMTLQGTSVNFLNEYYRKVKMQQDIIGSNLVGEERDKALKRLQETSAPNINATNPQLVEEYKQSPLSNLVNEDEYAGLKTLQLFDPVKYEQYTGILQATPDKVDAKAKISDIAGASKLQNSIDQQIGQETVHRKLLDIGRNNAATKLTADQYNLNEAYNNAQTPEQKNEIRNQYLANQDQLNLLKSAAKFDDTDFPLTASLKFDNQIKELTGQPGFGAIEFGSKRFIKGFGDTADTVVDLLTGLFGSDEDNAKLQMQRLGSTQNDGMYLPANLTGGETTLKADKDLQSKADAIIKGRNISDLSSDEMNQLRDLVSQNQDKITTVSNDKGKNFFSKATGYKIAGFTGDVASFMAQTAMLGAAGVPAKAAELATLFNTAYSNAYNEATSEGKSPLQANEYALVHGGVMMLAGAVSSKYEAVKGILGDSKSALGKEIAGIGENGWNRIVNGKLPLLKKLANASKSIVGENAKMIATYGVGTSIVNDLADKGIFNKNISTDEMVDHAFQSAKDMAIGSLALAGAGFIMHLAKNPVTFKDKAMFWENGVNPEIGKAKIDEAIANHTISESVGNARKKAIDNIATLIQKVPEKNDKGKDLTDIQKVEYLYNSIVKGKAKEAVSDLPPKQSEAAEMEGLVSEHKNQILLQQPTDKQLESRKAQLEKDLVPEKDEEGKIIEIAPKVLMQTKAELEAVNDAIKNKASENEKYQPKVEITKPTTEASITNEGINKVEQPTEEKQNEIDNLTTGQQTHLRTLDRHDINYFVDKLNELRYTPDNISKQYQLSKHWENVVYDPERYNTELGNKDAIQKVTQGRWFANEKSKSTEKGKSDIESRRNEELKKVNEYKQLFEDAQKIKDDTPDSEKFALKERAIKLGVAKPENGNAFVNRKGEGFENEYNFYVVNASKDINAKYDKELSELKPEAKPTTVSGKAEVISERTPEQIKEISREKILDPDKMDQKVTIPDYDKYNADTKELPLRKVKSIEARDELRKLLKTIDNVIKCV